jgi:hypothetical protein
MGGVLKSKSSKFLFSTKFHHVFAFLPGIQSSKPCSARLQYPDFTPISAVAPAFAGYFLLKIFFGPPFKQSPMF